MVKIPKLKVDISPATLSDSSGVTTATWTITVMNASNLIQSTGEFETDPTYVYAKAQTMNNAVVTSAVGAGLSNLTWNWTTTDGTSLAAANNWSASDAPVVVDQNCIDTDYSIDPTTYSSCAASDSAPVWVWYLPQLDPGQILQVTVTADVDVSAFIAPTTVNGVTTDDSTGVDLENQVTVSTSALSACNNGAWVSTPGTCIVNEAPDDSTVDGYANAWNSFVTGMSAAAWTDYIDNSGAISGQYPASPYVPWPNLDSTRISSVEQDSDRWDEVVTPLAPASIAVTKTADTTGIYTAGTQVTYTMTVTNTGATWIANLSLTDPLISNQNTGAVIADSEGNLVSPNPTISCADTSLAPGASTTCTGTYTVTEADLALALTNPSAGSATEGIWNETQWDGIHTGSAGPGTPFLHNVAQVVATPEYQNPDGTWWQYPTSDDVTNNASAAVPIFPPGALDWFAQLPFTGTNNGVNYYALLGILSTGLVIAVSRIRKSPQHML
jgi:uncharacterized repeat protein (TIGR01451 family)